MEEGPLPQLSTITLFDGVAVADFNGLPASASRWLEGVWEAEAGSGGGTVPWCDSVRGRGDFENCFGVARGAVL